MKIIEVCRVAPPPRSYVDSVNQSCLQFPLTFFDMLWLRFPQNQRLFFYEEVNHSFSEDILPKLKHSLSLTLQHFLPLAGNLTWPPNTHKPIVSYAEGDAVLLTVAESEADFYYLSSNSFRKAQDFHQFLPDLPVSDTVAPVIALQVTSFPNIGFSIGCTTHHAVLDGKSTAMFMKSWAYICSSQNQIKMDRDSALLPELTPPFYDRTVIKDLAELEKSCLNGWLKQNGPNNKSLKLWELKPPPADAIRGTFHLTQSNIENIKQWVHRRREEKRGHKPVVHISTFTITCAYTWVCLVRARKISSKKVQLGINVDCRARLEPTIPSTYFGNCIAFNLASVDTADLVGEDGVDTAVEAITEAIKQYNDGVLKRAEDMISFLFSVDLDGLMPIGIAGSPRFELYHTNFGWGKPRKVEMTSIDKTGAIYLSDTRDGIGGIEIGLVLTHLEMEAFASLFANGLEALSVHKTCEFPQGPANI